MASKARAGALARRLTRRGAKSAGGAIIGCRSAQRARFARRAHLAFGSRDEAVGTGEAAGAARDGRRAAKRTLQFPGRREPSVKCTRATSRHSRNGGSRVESCAGAHVRPERARRWSRRLRRAQATSGAVDAEQIKVSEVAVLRSRGSGQGAGSAHHGSEH
eukprot:6812789-Prymnesium_polylepis.1